MACRNVARCPQQTWRTVLDMPAAASNRSQNYWQIVCLADSGDSGGVTLAGASRDPRGCTHQSLNTYSTSVKSSAAKA